MLANTRQPNAPMASCAAGWHEKFPPFKIVSLLDMLEFNANNLVDPVSYFSKIAFIFELVFDKKQLHDLAQLTVNSRFPKGGDDEAKSALRVVKDVCLMLNFAWCPSRIAR